MTAAPSPDRAAFVAQLRAAGVGPEAAERAADRRFPKAPVLDTRASEKIEQAEIVKRFKVCGFKSYNLSQARASKQSPGLPDNYFVHRSRPLAVWVEAKRQKGARVSPAQVEFGDDCERCGVLYVRGDRYAAERFLASIGLARWTNGVFEPVGERS